MERRTMGFLATCAMALLSQQADDLDAAPGADDGTQEAAPSAVPSGPPPFLFSEVAKSSGIDFVTACGEPGKPRLIDQIGTGLAWFDYDGDGWLDLYCANGSTLAAWQGIEPNPRRPRLYRNLGDGTFADVTESAGLLSDHWGAGTAVGDIDNDGDPDLYVACVGPNLLYRNQGNGTFVEEAAGKPIAFPGVTPGAAFGDLDLDGDLDLYVSAYLKFDLANPPKAYGRKVRNLDVSLAPNDHAGAPDRFFLNDGRGVFSESTKRSGFLVNEEEHGFTVIFTDLDGDELPDLFVANDRTPNLLYRSRKLGLVEEVAEQAGVAVSTVGKPQACMGVAVADLNDDLLPDLFVTNFQGETNAAYISNGDGTWDDRFREFEKGGSSRIFVGWGAVFADLECDGDEDLLVINGHVNPQLETEVPQLYQYLQRPLLYRADHPPEGPRLWTECAVACGEPLAERHSGRGAAIADYDEDGDLDVAISDVDGPIRLLRNDTPRVGQFLKIKVEGAAPINRDGYGARVTIEAAGRRQSRFILDNSSYLCHNDPRAHFGLGPATHVDRITVKWPGGLEEIHDGPIEADRTLVIRYGIGIVSERRGAATKTLPSPIPPSKVNR
jgi:hypothetical protein